MSKPVLPSETPTVTRLLLGGACFAAILAALHLFAEVLVPVTAALMFTVMLLPAVNWMHQRNLPRALAAGLATAGTLVAIALVGYLSTALLLEIAQAATEGEWLGRILGRRGLARLDELGLSVNDESGRSAESQFVLDTTLRVLGGAGGIALALITQLLLLWELPDILRRVDRVLTRSFGPLEEGTETSLHSLGRELRSYLWIKCVVSLLTAAAGALLMLAVGLDQVLTFTALIFVLNFIPNIGSLVAAAPPVLVAAATLGFTEAALLASGLMLANIVLGNVLEPWWMAGRLSLSPVVVFLGVVFWGSLWGLAGALLSVPLTHLFVLALEVRDDTRWVAELLRPSRDRQFASARHAGYGTEPELPPVPRARATVRAAARKSSTLTGL